MRLLFRMLPLAIMLLSVCTVFGQGAKAILRASQQECLKVRFASFTSEARFKFFDRTDTLLMKGRLHLMKFDSNESGCIGYMRKEMDGKTDEFWQFPDRSVYYNGNHNFRIDTIDFKNAFEGNIHNELFNNPFLKSNPFEFLSETGHVYSLIDSSGNYYRIKVSFAKDAMFDRHKTFYNINKKTLLPEYIQSSIHDIKQGNTQFRELRFSNIQINTDSASLYLSRFRPGETDTLLYSQPYIPPPLLDSGTVAPSWILPVSGKNDSISLQQFQGKFVLIDFWYISCYPCQLAIPTLVKLQKLYKDQLVIIGINPFDTDNKLTPFILRNKISYTIVRCPTELFQTYHVSGFPTMYLIGPDGKIISSHVGFSEDKEYESYFIGEIGKHIKR